MMMEPTSHAVDELLTSLERMRLNDCSHSSDEYYQVLLLIENELVFDHNRNCVVRSKIGDSQLLENHLIPLLSSEHQCTNVLVVILRILVKLTLPLECTLVSGEVGVCPSSCAHFQRLQHFLLEYKKSFLVNSSATAAIVRVIRMHDVQETDQVSDLSPQTGLSLVNDSLILMRNLLHVPDYCDFYHLEPFSSDGEQISLSGSNNTTNRAASRDNWQDVYRKLVWNVMIQGLDSALLSLLSHSRHPLVNQSIVQLISLLFKELHVVQLQDMIQVSRATPESSDEEVESESSSSIQRSSSSSCISRDSSPSSSMASARVSRKQSSDLTGQKPDNSGKTDVQNSKTDDSDRMLNEYRVLVKTDSQSSVSGEKGHSVSQNGDSGHDSLCEGDQKAYREVGDERSLTDVPAGQEESTTHVLKGDLNVEGNRRQNTRELNTSGISHGSSEEDQSRVTRKVIKAHHRFTCQVNESDSSDEYNEKPRLTGEHVYIQTKKNSLPHRLTALLPANVVRSKCSSSICMESAVSPATHSQSRIHNSPSLLAPWDKKRGSSSKNFPLDLNSFVPTDDDIASLLKDFVFMFLHNSFADLVLDMKSHMVQHVTGFHDSHFFWIIGYFVKLAVSIDLDFHHMERLLTPDLFSLLVYKGVLLNEEMELLVANKDNIGNMRAGDGRHILKKMHLVVSALRELLYAVLSYLRREDGRSDRQSMLDLRNVLADMSDMRQMLLLYIRNFLSTVHSKQFLVEVILTHHVTMLLLEPVYMEGRFDLPLHLRQFATIQVMDNYGKVLLDFKTNNDFVNDCVLTIMHHVAGDLMSPECLFQPIILKTFSLIMESETEIKECWADLIEYIMIRFVKTAKKSPTACIQTMFGNNMNNAFNSTGSTSDSSESQIDALFSSHEIQLNTRSDCDRLYWLYLQFEQADDPIGLIADALSDEFDFQVEKKDVMSQLIAKGIIVEHDVERFNVHTQKDSSKAKDCVAKETNDGISAVVQQLYKSKMRQNLIWIHDFLLAVLAVRSLDDVSSSHVHAIAYYSQIFGDAIPLVPFNENQEIALKCPLFLEFLRELDFDLPVDSNILYPRIPLSVPSADILEFCVTINRYVDHDIICYGKCV